MAWATRSNFEMLGNLQHFKNGLTYSIAIKYIHRAWAVGVNESEIRP